MRPYLPVDREEFGFVFPATAAKSLQSCPTLCNPIDGSPPSSPVPRILQARTLEWVAIFVIPTLFKRDRPPIPWRGLKGSEYSLGLWSWEHDLSARWPRGCQAFWATTHHMHFSSVPENLVPVGSNLEKAKSLWVSAQSVSAMGLTGNSDFQEALTKPVFPNLGLQQSPAQPGPCPTSNLYSLPLSCSASSWPSLNPQKSGLLPTIGVLHVPFPGVCSILLHTGERLLQILSLIITSHAEGILLICVLRALSTTETLYLFLWLLD